VGIYSLDTSAVVKRYVAETGSGWINTLSSVQATLSKKQLPLPTLVAADQDLLAAAVAEGFAVDNPNNH
jgi:hypothetical protein